MRTSYQLSWIKSAVTDGKMSILDWILGKVLENKQEKIPTTQALDTSKEDRTKDSESFRSVEESYDDSFSHSYCDGNRSRHMKRRRDNESPLSNVSRSDSSNGRYRRSRSKRHKSTNEDDLTKPWMCEEEDPFTPRIRNFKSSRRTQMPNNVKMYNGTGAPEDHVKIFQATAHVERWAMPTWCHMFNSTLIGAARVWFDELPPESIDSYKDLKAAFLTMVQVETGRMKGAPECMRISGFMYGVNNPELTKRLNEHVPKTMEEMMITAAAFIRGEVAAATKKKAEYQLNIREGYSPVRQKKRGQAPERAKAIQAEVQKLVEAGIMREVYYHEWLSNPVMVKKHDSSWQMCVDFTDLNKACYHQIQLAEPDEEKTTFHTGQGVYSYTKMPFGLKNAGATYQRLMDKAFESQIGQNIEVYVDDLVVKSYTEAEMMRDIEETFRTLRKINMKLNPKKYAFGLAKGVFLGYVVTPDGIKPCLDKTAVVLQLPSPRTIKEILADFLIEMPGENPQAAPAAETQQEPWTLFTDGSSCVNGSGVGLILTNPEGIEFTYALRFQFAASNNEAEYEALIAGLRIATRMGVKNVHVSVDSKLVASQVLGTYVAKEENMVKYLDKVKCLVRGFTNFSISQVPRSKNKKANALSKIASTSFAHLSKQILVEVLKDRSIKEKEVATVVEEDGLTWMTPIVEYLKEGTLPSDKKEARKLRIKARQYELMEGILYKRSFLTPWLRCVGPLQAEYVDARDMIRKCNDFQIHRPITRSPQQPLTPIMALWPFYKWGIDIAGPFPEGPVSDNGKQFSDNPFKDWCDKLNITQRFALVKHPQSNGLVERANRRLREGIKARLGEGNTNWVEEHSYVLWAHRTMIKSSHGDTPFSLTYGTEAVIPIEIGMPTYRTAAVDVVSNDEELRLNLDLLEERRERTAIYEAKAKSKMTKWEGPYEVTEALGDAAYHLRSMDGTILPRTWKISNLKRCYL
uniref:Reverse transcriptase domain-containing protein n=1 Tax=Tanacetum cinerariifolium TaxID=118510 RepID=A0A6L2LZ48_TANCI|nr:reverse transcriptase domain-containing protein [Tanacetum cinerariifolium]